MSKIFGTLAYMSPEMMAFEKGVGGSGCPGRKTDIWSYGCVIAFMWGRGKLQRRQNGSLINLENAGQTQLGPHQAAVMSNAGTPLFALPENVPYFWEELMQNCFSYVCDNRPKSSKIRQDMQRELSCLHLSAGSGQ